MSRCISLPWHMYRHYPADFSRWSESASGFHGWASEVRDLDLDRCCLAMMHFPDTGLSAETEWGPDSPNPAALGTVEWVPRTMDVMTFRMPRLIEASRKAGMLVAHVGVSADFHKSGEIWENCEREAGEAPKGANETVDRGWQAQHQRDVFDLPRPQPEEVPHHSFLLPDVFRPVGTDIIAEHAWQLHHLLQNRGIDHILYTGWALNWCLWFSPCGMSDMSRTGYLCSAVRGGCVAIENRESAVGEGHLEYALWKTSTMFGYVFELHELTNALRISDKRSAAEKLEQ